MNSIKSFMKKNYKIIILVLALSAVLWSFLPKPAVTDPEKDKALIELLTMVLQRAHYSPVDIDDAFSEKVYNKYINGIDPVKRFFIQKDIDEFKKYKHKIDDILLSKEKDLTFFEITHQRIIQRMKESKEIYTDILSKPIDFNSKEFINVDYENRAFAKNNAELKEIWRKQLKLSLLSSISDKQKLEKDKQEKDAEYKPKSFEEIEKEARESSKKSLDEYLDFVTKELNRNDWFSIFLNTIAESFDPHTSYFSPENKERFEISMSGKFEGIGARLQKKNDVVEVSELISGGPAWRGKELEAGDIILKVAQGKEEPLDIAGMRLDDVVKKIKGAKGTEVRLTVKKVDGTINVISIVRDEVETEETFAKSTTVLKNNQRYGIIHLPKFYINFDKAGERNAYTDVAKEIEKLKNQDVKGIILDLRDNGGGSLETVVKMTGLFIEKGPVVQVKAPNRRPDVLYDEDKGVLWNGPLVVMINNFSASASEIFAAAIQDYNRGIVVGSKHSYGKGTVQNIVDLNQLIRGNTYGDLGSLKTTIQKFYRINGGSTQKEGVKSDIVFPDRFFYLDMGERDDKDALPWDKIEPANYLPLANNFDVVKSNSQKRIDENENFKLILENAKWIFDRKDENNFSLNLNDFKVETHQSDEMLQKFKAINNYNNNLSFQYFPKEVSLFEKDSLLKQKKDRWHEDLQKDIYIDEALNVLDDIKINAIGVIKKGTALKN